MKYTYATPPDTQEEKIRQAIAEALAPHMKYNHKLFGENKWESTFGPDHFAHIIMQTLDKVSEELE